MLTPFWNIVRGQLYFTATASNPYKGQNLQRTLKCPIANNIVYNNKLSLNEYLRSFTVFVEIR